MKRFAAQSGPPMAKKATVIVLTAATLLPSLLA
jgi:hypothetical protein